MLVVNEYIRIQRQFKDGYTPHLIDSMMVHLVFTNWSYHGQVMPLFSHCKYFYATRFCIKLLQCFILKILVFATMLALYKSGHKI